MRIKTEVGQNTASSGLLHIILLLKSYTSYFTAQTTSYPVLPCPHDSSVLKILGQLKLEKVVNSKILRTKNGIPLYFDILAL